jgi:hypothetical protein
MSGGDEARVPVMEFRGPDGRTYQITALVSISYEARVGGRVVLGHPDLKLMLGQIREGKAG